MKAASKFLWPLAVGCWLVAVAAYAIAAEAGQPVPMIGYFTWPQVVVLVGIGAAWGDSRRRTADIERRLEQIERCMERNARNERP